MAQQLEVWRDGRGPEATPLTEADLARGRAMWQHYESLTNQLSMELAEQLRLVLEPTLASKLQARHGTHTLFAVWSVLCTRLAFFSSIGLLSQAMSFR